MKGAKILSLDVVIKNLKETGRKLNKLENVRESNTVFFLFHHGSIKDI
jgi:hypothetical protein